MLIGDAMLVLANQAGQAESMRGAHIALQRFGPHANEDVGANQPRGHRVGIAQNLHGGETRNRDA